MSTKTERMVENYEMKLRMQRLPLRKGLSVEQQVEHFRIAHEHLAEVRHATSEVLCNLGVWTMYFPYYYAFAQQVDKNLRNGMCDYRLLRETRALVELWVVRGLDRETMKSILSQVLNVDVKRMYSDEPVSGAGQEPASA